MEQLAKDYLSVEKPPETSTPTGAFTELCGQFSAYSNDAGPTVSYQRDLVSLPPTGMCRVDISDFLEGEAQLAWRHWRSHLLRPTAEARQILRDRGFRKPHSDPLTQDAHEWGAFVSELICRGLVTLKTMRSATLGLFF
eukprot:507911-Amphidinium_carterae.1